MIYGLNGSRLQIAADTLGAELVSAVCDGKERLWQNPTGEWGGHAPVLFPVCGNCGVTVNGETYPVLPHGFAKRSQFVLSGRSENSLTFALDSSEETRRCYPYDFRFTVTYRINGNRLGIEYAVHNPGGDPLYASCGGHESYALEGGVENYALEFSQEEAFTSLLHGGDGRLTGETVEFGRGKIFPLPKDFLRENRTLIFRVRSKTALLKTNAGAAVARVSFEGFPYLLLWHPFDSHMICIEPWHNLPDGGAEREFSKKEGVFCVNPHQTVRFSRTVEYL